MSFDLLSLSTDWRLMRKLSNMLSKVYISLSVRRIVLLRMVPEPEMCSIWGWGQNQVDEAVFFSVMHTII